MWLLSWNPNSDFYSQFEVGEQISSLDGKSIWSIFRAKKKSSNQAVTLFRIDFKESCKASLIERAKQFLKRIKTLRHPSILKYVDSNETEKSICIVTESVSPLADYLNEESKDLSQSQKEFSIAYGLLNIAKGLQFINNDCNLNHNNININSIFVNQSGVWKIGGLEFICSVETQSEKNELLCEKYIPPERAETSKVRPGPPYAVDSWGFGCLVWECFNRPLAHDTNIKTIGKMPKPLSSFYNKLVQSSPRHRVTPMDFVNDSKKAGVFFNTPLIETILYLEEIQLVKEPDEKTRFFNKLNEELDSFPQDIRNNKILPDLINAFEYGEAGSAILNPIFTIGRFLDETAYQNKLVPCIIKLYGCKDRATRSKLLQQLDSYLSFLQPNVINDQIFPQIVQGFMDSNCTIREQTVKSILQLAPKLNSSNMNEVMTHFTRILTRDEEGGIRANTTVCLGKIAKHLTSQLQQSVLLPSFLRMFRDPFPPARHAAIAAISANEGIFSIKDCATRIMPSICQMCIDPDVNVRRLSFKSLRLFVDKVEEKSEKEANPTKKQGSESTIKGDDRSNKNSTGSDENLRKESE